MTCIKRYYEKIRKHPTSCRQQKTPNNTEIPLGRQNYMLILLGVIILVIGFISCRAV